MQRLLAIVVALGACKGGGETGDKQPPPAPPAPPPKPVYVSAPASDAVLPLDKLPPPSHVVWIDRAGELTYARIKKPWDATLPAQHLSVKDLATLAAKLQADIAADEAADPKPEVIDYPMDISESFAPMSAVGRVPAVVGSRGGRRRVPLVIAEANLPAAAVIGVLASLGGRLGVVLPGDQIGALRYVFQTPVVDDHDTTFWYEAHVGTDRIEMLELVANERTPTTGDSVRAQLAPFVTDKGFDLLFDRAVPFPRLVNILLAVDDLGVTTQLGLGVSPGPIDGRKLQALEARNSGGDYRTATAILSFGQTQVNGDLDKKDVRAVFISKRPELTACYVAGLATNPQLRGTVVMQFSITPMGTVSSVSASGVDPKVASCMSKLFQAFPFPSPKGGGRAQVMVPLSFRPIET